MIAILGSHPIICKTTNEKPPSSRWVSLTKRCAVSNSRGLLMDAVAIEMRLRTKGI